MIGTPRISDDGERVEIGYKLHSDYWGRGYASEALDLFKKIYWDEQSIASDFLNIVEP
jgi:RimJ/RimL family protein N-acetyltransferase